jgi:hypothetical protein
LTSKFIIKVQLKHIILGKNTALTWQSDEVDLELTIWQSELHEEEVKSIWPYSRAKGNP